MVFILNMLIFADDLSAPWKALFGAYLWILLCTSLFCATLVMTWFVTTATGVLGGSTEKKTGTRVQALLSWT